MISFDPFRLVEGNLKVAVTAPASKSDSQLPASPGAKQFFVGTARGRSSPTTTGLLTAILSDSPGTQILLLVAYLWY